VELVLKASVASRTLDNITAVLVSFKNFRKALKNNLQNSHNSLKLDVQEKFRPSFVNQLLFLPNIDLNYDYVEKPQNLSKSS
jgi:hypothetical protein